MSGGISQSFGQSRSSPSTVSPFGQMPWRLSMANTRQFAMPGQYGLGFDAPDRFLNRLETANGPMADFIRDVRGFSGNVIDQASDTGAKIASEAPAAYDAYRAQVMSGLDQMGDARGYADRMAEEAFDPVAGRAMFQEASRRALDPLAASGAARGVYGGGGQQGMEQDVLTALALNFAANDQANQGAAIDRLQSTATGGADLASGLMQGLPLLQQLMGAAYNEPLNAAGSLYSLLSGAGSSPALQLLSQVAPVVAQKSKAWNGSGSVSGGMS